MRFPSNILFTLIFSPLISKVFAVFELMRLILLSLFESTSITVRSSMIIRCLGPLLLD